MLAKFHGISHQCVGGIMVSIAAFQAVDPGSIPGRRNFFSIYNQMCKGSCVKFMNPGVNVPRGLTARISGFHPGGPGSTPGVGSPFLFFRYLPVVTRWPSG